MYDIFGARLTRGRDVFTLWAHAHAFAFYLIAENIPARSTVIEHPTEEVWINELKKNYDYAAIQVMTLHIDRISKMVKIAKRIVPETKIVLGGYGVSTLYDPPPWRITFYKGDGSAPKVIGRQFPNRHRLADLVRLIIKNFIDYKPGKNHIRLNDIDDFPVSFTTIEIEDNLMNYVDEGKGETILMLHGNPTWSYLYRHFIKELKKDYRCIALDHLGYGLSDKPANGDYTMEAHIRRLGIFIEKLNLKNITLICQDWGGIIGLGYAANNKDKFKRLIPMNTAGFLPEKPGEFLKGAMGAWAFPYLWSFKILILGKMMGMDWNILLNASMRLGIHNRKRQLHKKAMAGYRYPFQRVRDRIAILKSVRQIPIYPGGPIFKLLRNTGQLLKGWDIRTQVIWGMKDPVFRPWAVDKFEELLPTHAPSLKIPGASHFLQDDEPGIIIDKIKEFMADSKEAKSRAKDKYNATVG